MRTNWSRARAILGLLVAIFADLQRRAWWLGRRRSVENMPHSTSIVAPRPVEQRTYVPEVGSLWRPVVDRALSVQATGVLPTADGQMLPQIIVNVDNRPEVADLPRVLTAEVSTEIQATVGANWLADPSITRAILVVTFVEPVTCTWAISFDLPRCLSLLEKVADRQELYVTFHRGSLAELELEDAPGAVFGVVPPEGLVIRVGRPDHLRAILKGWAAQHELR